MTQQLNIRLLAFLMLMVTLAPLPLFLPFANAQSTVISDPKLLMDKMTGSWVMTGTIGKEQVTHDVHVDWILNRQYIRIHEVSREKNANEELKYEAWIHIAWDQKNSEYVVMWLDTTGTTNFAAEGVGHGTPNEDEIPFVWKFVDGSGIRNTFAYDRENDKWSWAIDNVDESGKQSEFARLTLERKQIGKSKSAR